MSALAYALRSSPPKWDLWERFRWLDDKLVAAGFPPTSPFWLDEVERLYRSDVRAKVWRVGRRGGKSSTLAGRCAVVETLYGDHYVPPGDTGEYNVISVKREDATKRLDTIEAVLRLGLGMRPRVDYYRVDGGAKGAGIWLQGRRLAFKVQTASFRTNVGQTSIGVLFDEEARYRDEASSKNPGKHILSTVLPSLATMPNAYAHHSSSPWSTLDVHYEQFERGETSRQQVAHAESWRANPTLTPERCWQLLLEEDEDDSQVAFDREFGAIPMPATAQAFFDPRAIDACTDLALELPRAPLIGEQVVAGVDLGYRSDSAALAIAHIQRPEDEEHSRYVIGELVELRPEAGALKPSEVCGRFAGAIRAHGGVAGMADQFGQDAAAEYFAEAGLGYLAAPRDVPATYTRARTLMHQGRLVLPTQGREAQRLLRDLRLVEAVPTSNGRITMRLPRYAGGGHGDLVSALVLSVYQRGGQSIAHRTALPYGWTREELDDAERLERELDEPAQPGGWTRNRGGWTRSDRRGPGWSRR